MATQAHEILREVKTQVVNEEGSAIKMRKCWTGKTKVGTIPMNVYYLRIPVVGQYVEVIHHGNPWKIERMKVDHINEVCIFLSR